MEEKKQEGALGKFINEHPFMSFLTVVLMLDFAKDMTEIFVNRKKGE